MRETSANEPLMTHRNCLRWHRNRGTSLPWEQAWRIPTYWLCGVRCKGGVTLIRALVRNLRTRLAMVREKTQAERTVRSKVPRRGPGADCFVIAEKRGNARGAIVSRRREQRHAVREMRVDPSEPPCRGRFQTAISCYGPMAAVVNVMVKRRDNLITSCGDERDECKRTAEDASKGHKWHQNRGVALPWEKHGGYLLTGHAVSGV